VRDFSAKSELPQTRLVTWVGIAHGKFFDWRHRYGKANEHNALRNVSMTLRHRGNAI
jgi:hypothetical protein